MTVYTWNTASGIYLTNLSSHAEQIQNQIHFVVCGQFLFLCTNRSLSLNTEPTSFAQLCSCTANSIFTTNVKKHTQYKNAEIKCHTVYLLSIQSYISQYKHWYPKLSVY